MWLTLSLTLMKAMKEGTEIREMVQLGILFIYLLLLCGWGYIVALTKVLKICQIYHTWIHPFHIQRVYESIIKMNISITIL
jgi:hypothetical protein